MQGNKLIPPPALKLKPGLKRGTRNWLVEMTTRDTVKMHKREGMM